MFRLVLLTDMIDIPWQSVLDQITAFTHTSIVAGYVPYVLGFGIGVFIVKGLISLFWR